MLLSLQKTQEAIDCVENAMKLRPESALLNFQAAKAYQKANFFGKCQEAFQKSQMLVNSKTFDPAEFVTVRKQLVKTLTMRQEELDRRKGEVIKLDQGYRNGDKRTQNRIRKELQNKSAELQKYFEETQKFLLELEEAQVSKFASKLDALYEKCKAYEKAKQKGSYSKQDFK